MNNCKCGKWLHPNNKSGFCFDCMTNSTCIVCGVVIGKTAWHHTKKCRKCALRAAAKLKILPDEFCLTCGEKIKTRNRAKTRLCVSCSNKAQGFKKRGKNFVSADRRCKCGEKIASSLLQNKSGKCMTCSSGLRQKKYHNGYFWSLKNNKEIYFGSSYELAALKKFEKDDHIIKFDRCPYKIPYVFENKKKRYFPDFLLNNLEIVEVKAAWELTTEQILAKLRAAEQFVKENNMKFTILTESQLEGL
jgi:hypothetical protein